MRRPTLTYRSPTRIDPDTVRLRIDRCLENSPHPDECWEFLMEEFQAQWCEWEWESEEMAKQAFAHHGMCHPPARVRGEPDQPPPQKTKAFRVVVDREKKEQIDTLAWMCGIPKSDLVRSAIGKGALAMHVPRWVAGLRAKLPDEGFGVQLHPRADAWIGEMLDTPVGVKVLSKSGLVRSRMLYRRAENGVWEHSLSFDPARYEPPHPLHPPRPPHQQIIPAGNS